MPKQKKNPHPHESWCLKVALRFCGRPRIHERFRQNRIVDAILFMPAPIALWGHLAGFLSQREVLIEHFSNSVTEPDFFASMEKIAYASQRYSRIRLKDRGTRKHPVMVILTHRRPDRLLREAGLFQATECSGIWVRPPLDFGAVFLIVTSRLPEDPTYDWMRLTTRVPESKQDLQKVESLLKRHTIDKLTRKEMEDYMLQLIIDGKTPKELMAEIIRLQTERTAVEQEKIAAEQEKIAAEQEKIAAEQEKIAAEQEKIAAEARHTAERAAFQSEIDQLRKQLDELKKR